MPVSLINKSDIMSTTNGIRLFSGCRCQKNEDAMLLKVTTKRTDCRKICNRNHLQEIATGKIQQKEIVNPNSNNSVKNCHCCGRHRVQRFC